MTAPQQICTRIIRVDSKVAEYFLTFEKQPEKGVEGTNRKFSQKVVDGYHEEMLTGQWGFSHQGFAFTGSFEDGTVELKDGGQRCRAIILAATKDFVAADGTVYPANPDFAIDVMVTEGLDPQSWLVMDIGRRRQAADFLQADGKSNSLVLSSAVRLSYLYENVPWSPEAWSSARLTPAMRKRYLDDNPGLVEAVSEGARVGRIMIVGAAAAGYYQAIKSGVSESQIQEFIGLLQSGAGMEFDNAALQLRELLRNSRDTKRRYPREEQLALFIKAFNKWRNGVKTELLYFRTRRASNGSAPEAFPRFGA